MALDHFGLVGAAAILWPNDAAKIQAIAELDKPQFTWSPTPPNGDSILIADVAGDRGLVPQILKQVMAHWPDSPRKRLFTYRRGRLVELSWKTVKRFTYGKLAENS